ncbi:MAG: universal stress protein [Ilumatobacteraceae bacterium]|jgi:nucleotide-binding universal stress UspA family protein
MTIDRKGTVVVGVDGSPDSGRALDWAIDEAIKRHLRVRLVHGVEVGVSMASPYGGGMVLEQLEEAGRTVLDEAEERVRAAGLDVDSCLEIGSGAHALIEQSKDADLLVVGCRGHGGFVGMLLGSVSSAVTHHAHCPVLVVRPEHSTLA